MPYAQANKIEIAIVIEVVKGMKGNWIEAVAKMGGEVFKKVISTVEMTFGEVLELSKGIHEKDKLIIEFVQ